MGNQILVQLVIFCAVIVAVCSSLVIAFAKDNEDSNSNSNSKCGCNEALINRRGFPEDFIFGSASAAYQIEGAYTENEKGPSMWDNFTHTYPDKIKDRSNADVTIDSYHLYKEDVKILRNMGVDAYKFSVSWSRILPGGSVSEGVNHDGIDYYNRLIDDLLANGVEPWITMLHLDLPQALQDEYGGFLSPQIVADFVDFAELLFREFGDRVKYSFLGYTDANSGVPTNAMAMFTRNKSTQDTNKSTGFGQDKIRDKSNADVAIDSYHLYKEDVKILRNMGVDAYKFSVSWSRILPGGSISKGVNKDGIDYYNRLINELLADGVEPWITMLHLDLPQALQDEYGGFLSPKIVADFVDFAELLFREFGDRVKYWITINEPWGLSFLGYTRGIFAPGRCDDWIGNNCVAGDSAVEPYKVTHYQLLAHAAVVKLYRTKYQELQKGKIGLTVNSFWFVPYDETEENYKAKDRALDFMLGWIMDPITFGKYPESMRERVGARLPEFTKEESDMVRGSIDFLGANYYSSNYARNIPRPTHVSYLTDSGAEFTGLKNGIPIGKQGSTHSWYYAYPKGLREVLRYLKEKYNNPLIYITENGLDLDRNDSIPMSEALQDYERKDYFLDHLCCLREALELDGANVKGFFAWSLTDNYEWISGYLVRFGLHYIDFKSNSFKRYPKHSALWFKSILKGRTKKPESRRISDQ